MKKTGLLFLTIFLGFAAASFATVAIPPLETPVTDKAKIIGDKTKAELNEYLMAVSEQTGVQVAVLTVPTLDGESIESFSMRVCEKWKIGRKGDDNGVLLTVALEEHEMRIEVGYGLEGLLTDMKCGQIIRNEIAPRFRNDAYSAGIKAGVLSIVGIATDGAEIEGEAAENLQDSGETLSSIIPLLVWLAFFLFIVLHGSGALPFLYCLMTGRPYVRRTYRHSGGFDDNDSFGGHSGGFGGGFGGSSGGFSGGGGSFGGGGSSGKW